MTIGRRVRALVAVTGLTATALFGWQAIAAANGDNTRPGDAMGRMQRLMGSGDAGMAEMHDAMMEMPHSREAHERMGQDPDMARLHSDMMGATVPQMGGQP